MKRKGVDISGPISPCTAADLKAAGVEFVICKTGFGSDYPGQQDSGFAANVKLLDAAGIPWGAITFPTPPPATGASRRPSTCCGC